MAALQDPNHANQVFSLKEMCTPQEKPDAFMDPFLLVMSTDYKASVDIHHYFIIKSRSYEYMCMLRN